MKTEKFKLSRGSNCGGLKIKIEGRLRAVGMQLTGLEGRLRSKRAQKGSQTFSRNTRQHITTDNHTKLDKEIVCE